MKDLQPIIDIPHYFAKKNAEIWSDKSRNGKGVGKLHKLTPVLDRDGYNRVCIQTPDGQSFRTVASLVMLAFVGYPPPGMQICHGKGGKQDDSLANLKYDTAKANMADKHRDGTAQIGENNHFHKLKRDEVLKIREIHATEKPTYRSLANQFGVSRHTVEKIVTRRTWTHI